MGILVTLLMLIMLAPPALHKFDLLDAFLVLLGHLLG